MKPTFIGIGAQKCASTWLYDILSDHPEVCLSEDKELDFFSSFFDRGYQWYENHFPNPGRRRVSGEISPSYFHSPGVPERVQAYHPDAKLILFLRDPLKRAISNHKHEVRIGHLTGNDLSFEFGMSNNPLYVEQGRYATHLARWLKCFPREQIHIVLFDDVVSDGQVVASRVYDFLDIKTSHVPASLGERSNESYVNRSRGVENVKNSFRGAIRAVGLGSVWEGIGKSGMRSAYRKLNRAPSNSVIPPMRPETKQGLLAIFAEETERLEELTGLDLSRWQRPE